MSQTSRDADLAHKIAEKAEQLARRVAELTDALATEKAATAELEAEVRDLNCAREDRDVQITDLEAALGRMAASPPPYPARLLSAAVGVCRAVGATDAVDAPPDVWSAHAALLGALVDLGIPAGDLAKASK